MDAKNYLQTKRLVWRAIGKAHMHQDISVSSFHLSQAWELYFTHSRYRHDRLGPWGSGTSRSESASGSTCIRNQRTRQSSKKSLIPGAIHVIPEISPSTSSLTAWWSYITSSSTTVGDKPNTIDWLTTVQQVDLISDRTIGTMEQFQDRRPYGRCLPK